MKLLFMGRKSTAASALKWTVSAGFEVVGVLTDSHLSISPTADAAESLGIPILHHDRVCESIANGSLDFDVAVSIVYWRKVNAAMLAAARYGIVNFHPAPLPTYKGTAGYNLGILNGENEWAVTAHYMDEEIDTGEIIELFKFSIDNEEETANSLEVKTQEFLLSLYKKTMRRILKSQVLPSTTNSGGTYTSRKQMERLKRLEDNDDWDRKIRAFWFPPYLCFHRKEWEKVYGN